MKKRRKEIVKMKKSVLTLSLALAVMFGMMVGAKASDVVETITATLDSSIKVVYNGETQEMKDASGNTVYPISYDGTTYLPVRAISNLLGLEVNWDGPTRTVWLGEGFVPTPTETASSDDWRQNMLTDLPGYIDVTGGYYLDPNALRGTIGGSSASDPEPASTSSSGVQQTPGGDGTFYADANGGSNGRNFDAADLYVDPADAAVDISGMIY